MKAVVITQQGHRHELDAVEPTAVRVLVENVRRYRSPILALTNVHGVLLTVPAAAIHQVLLAEEVLFENQSERTP